MDVATRSSVESFRWKRYGKDQADQGLIQLSTFYCYVTELKDVEAAVQMQVTGVRLLVWNQKHYELLRSVATQLFRCAGSTAADERNFSTYASIHSKLHNQFSPDRVEKLVYISFNDKNVNEEDLDEYTHIEDVLLNSEVDEDAKDKNQGEAFVYY
ncbi:Transposase [Phytophthora megakarya]|uniref:Transposase n=1 Tax=Phytophthora megakarya TaxID=4795 RepID=A0A225WX74_9STRA|nr:Transposase [Phytophthora megakarya]